MQVVLKSSGEEMSHSGKKGYWRKETKLAVVGMSTFPERPKEMGIVLRSHKQQASGMR